MARACCARGGAITFRLPRASDLLSTSSLSCMLPSAHLTEEETEWLRALARARTDPEHVWVLLTRWLQLACSSLLNGFCFALTLVPNRASGRNVWTGADVLCEAVRDALRARLEPLGYAVLERKCRSSRARALQTALVVVLPSGAAVQVLNVRGDDDRGDGGGEQSGGDDSASPCASCARRRPCDDLGELACLCNDWHVHLNALSSLRARGNVYRRSRAWVRWTADTAACDDALRVLGEQARRKRAGICERIRARRDELQRHEGGGVFYINWLAKALLDIPA